MSKQTKKSKKSAAEVLIKIVLILLIILILGLAGTIVYDFLTENNIIPSDTSKEPVVKRNVVVNDISDSLPAPDPLIVDSVKNHDIKMNSAWVFQNGKSVSSNAYVANPAVNKNALFFEVFAPDGKTKLLTSPVLAVGSHMENIALEKELSAGTYNCIMKYTLLGSDGETAAGTLQVELQIIISS